MQCEDLKEITQSFTCSKFCPLFWVTFLFIACSLYSMGQGTPAPVNGASSVAVSKPQSASTVSSVPPAHSGKDYDFSSLTQGMFGKP